MSGNLCCQIFLAQAALLILTEMKTKNLQIQYDKLQRVQHDFEFFTEMAAKSGDAGSQFNLAKLYLARVDSDVEYFDQEAIENIKQAKHWLRMAARQELRVAKELLRTLEVFDCWRKHVSMGTVSFVLIFSSDSALIQHQCS